MYDLYIFFEKRFLWQQYALQPRFCDEDGFNRQPLSFSTNFFDRLYRVLRRQKISPIVFCRWYFVSTRDKNFGSGDFMRRGRAPEYVFLAAVLQLQIAQEYLTLWRSVSGRYAAAVRRHLSAALAALYGSAGAGRRAVWPLSGSGAQNTRPFLTGKAHRLWLGSTICSAAMRLSSRIRSLPPLLFPKRRNVSQTPRARSGISEAVSLPRQAHRLAAAISPGCTSTGSAESRSPAGQTKSRPFRARADCACSFL